MNRSRWSSRQRRCGRTSRAGRKAWRRTRRSNGLARTYCRSARTTNSPTRWSRWSSSRWSSTERRDHMQPESLGKLLPRVFLPYAQQWAERSGMPLLSKLLVDDHLRALIERYGDELLERFSQAQRAAPKGKGKANGRKPALHLVGDEAQPAGEDAELSDLNERLHAIEAQYELLLGVLETVRTKMKPLAASLGCCPECLVGVTGCHKCLGKSKVGYYEPDAALLQSVIVDPLAARGVPLALVETPPRPARRAADDSPETRTRSKQWPRK